MQAGLVIGFLSREFPGSVQTTGRSPEPFPSGRFDESPPLHRWCPRAAIEPGPATGDAGDHLRTQLLAGT
jgi:hypothetical protein